MVGAGQWLPVLWISISVIAMFALNDSATSSIGKRRRPGGEFPLKRGRAYVVYEAAPDSVFRALLQAIQTGLAGLAVSRRNPSSLREDFGLETARILWLTETEGEDRLSPANVDGLVQPVTSLLAQHGRAVVGLDGVDYVLECLGRDSTVRVLRTLRDLVTGSGGIFLVSVDDATSDDRVASLFRRDFETLTDPGHADFKSIDVFVIDGRSGILLSHVAEESMGKVDADVVAGMLTVIMDFAKKSFAERMDELRQLEMGDKTILIERGNRFLVVVVFTGEEPPSLRPRMQAFAARAERQYADLLEGWSGDMSELQGLEIMAGDAFLSREGGDVNLPVRGRGAPTGSLWTEGVLKPPRSRSSKKED